MLKIFKPKNYETLLIDNKEIKLSNRKYYSMDDVNSNSWNDNSMETILITNITEIEYTELSYRIIIKYNEKMICVEFETLNYFNEFIEEIKRNFNFDKKENLTSKYLIYFIPTIVTVILFFVSKNAENEIKIRVLNISFTLLIAIILGVLKLKNKKSYKYHYKKAVA